jgi:hypothetical protein
MGLNILLTKIPRNINVVKLKDIETNAKIHALVVNAVGLAVLGWFATIPMANFPVALGPKRVESRAFPDYASGQVFTEYRTVHRSFSFI